MFFSRKGRAAGETSVLPGKRNAHPVLVKFVYWSGVLVLLLLPLAIYFRVHFFFLYDDWTELFNMAQYGFLKYIFSPNGDIWFPFFRIVFYLLVNAIGRHYEAYIAINCLLLGANVACLWKILAKSIDIRMAYVLCLYVEFSPVNTVIVWNAFYACYLLSLLFFFIAWLLTIEMMRHDAKVYRILFVAAIFASITSHPYTFPALIVFPLYIYLSDKKAHRKLSISIAVSVVSVMICYLGLYLMFNPIRILPFGSPSGATNFHPQQFLMHWLYGSFLSPFAEFNFTPDKDRVEFVGWIIFASTTGIFVLVMCFGNIQERTLAIAGMAFNLCAFFLVSLARHQLFLEQALSTRYGFFCIVGQIMLFGAFWNILIHSRIDKIVTIVMPVSLLGWMFYLSLEPFAALDAQYTHLSRASQLSYAGFSALSDRFTSDEAATSLLYPQLRVFTEGQARELQQLLGR